MNARGSRSALAYFRWPFGLTAAGLALAGLIGWLMTGTIGGAGSAFFICAVLAVLEVSLSFDNAIVNANKLQEMAPAWRRRFLTWGLVIAVFGMRAIFPLVIVSVFARVGPLDAVRIAATEPAEYARIMTQAHLPIAAFGGTFLMMVGLAYFFDQEKDVHWVKGIEGAMARFATIEGGKIAVVLMIVLAFSSMLAAGPSSTFVVCAIAGLLTFLVLEIAGSLLDASGQMFGRIAGAGIGAFLYLEVLDASFSFDGVVGAFALTQNIFIMTIGLGIGAIYVRSMTVMLVEKGTLTEYRYVEHGAFYAVLILAAIMYLQTLMHVPDAVTGLIGALSIGASLWSSVRYNRRHRQAV